jgi:hypothetical protein
LVQLPPPQVVATKGIVEVFGGTFHGAPNLLTNLLLVGDEETEEEVLVRGLGCGIDVVHYDWVAHSVQAGHQLPVADFARDRVER